MVDNLLLITDVLNKAKVVFICLVAFFGSGRDLSLNNKKMSLKRALLNGRFKVSIMLYPVFVLNV